MILNVTLLLMILKLSRCSIVMDPFSQNTLYVSNYCPTMKYCSEGTHVMCMYYDHDRTVGAQCKNYVKVTITPEIMGQILDNVNEIRSKLSIGKETGRNGHLLPRAYGMMKLSWDSELATLAQVLANQCLGLREDLCRATEKFPEPSQIITLINFKVPNWDYISRNSSSHGLTSEKISFAIDRALSSLHAVKRFVSDDIVTDCPPLGILPDMGSRSYLKLIRGRATHIGCGISAYTRYHAMDNAAQNIYNSVQIVCNISDGPQAQQPLYNTDPPIPGTGFSEVCGCPSGYRESKGCLCESDSYHTEGSAMSVFREHHPRGEDSEELKKPRQALMQHIDLEPCDEADGNCESNAVGTQNIPPSSYEEGSDMEMQYRRKYGNINNLPPGTSIEDNEISNERYKELPYSYKKDPRNKYMNNKISGSQHRRAYSGQSRNRNSRNHDSLSSNEIKPTSGIEYSSVEDRLDPNERARLNNEYNEKLHVNDVYEEKDNDNTFLSLLDVLERAVKNIELDGNEKEIFDIKMRKIYESVLNTRRQNSKFSKPIITRNEIEADIQDISDNIKQSSLNSVGDDRIAHNADSWLNDLLSMDESRYGGKEHVYNFLERKDTKFEHADGLDERLVNIMNRKKMSDDLDRQYEYIVKHNLNNINDYMLHNAIEEDDENDEYTDIPAHRMQEKIPRYVNSNLKETPGNERHNKNNHSILDKFGFKKSNGKKKRVMTDDERRKQAANIDKAIKTFGSKSYSKPEKTTRRAHRTPHYRRTLETDVERLKMISKSTKSHNMDPRKMRYHMSNRATFDSTVL